MPTREQASTGFSRRPTTCQPGCVRLSEHLRRLYNLSNAGCYNPNSHLSSGAPSWHVYGKAIDLGCNWNDPAQRQRGDQCFEWVLARREELNLQQMIWGNRIYDVSYGGVRTYRHDDHKTHLHIAIGYQASQSWQPRGGVAAPSQPVPQLPAGRKAKPVVFIQTKGIGAIALYDIGARTKHIYGTPHQFEVDKWMLAINGLNVNVQMVDRELWDSLRNV